MTSTAEKRIVYDPVKTPAGPRIQLQGSELFPKELASLLVCPSEDSPNFIGSAYVNQRCIHPCIIMPSHKKPCLVPYGGNAIAHNGAYDVLIFDGRYMEWVASRVQDLPAGRVAVLGGCEEDGHDLYHARTKKRGRMGEVVHYGKAGSHLGMSYIAENREQSDHYNYEIL